MKLNQYSWLLAITVGLFDCLSEASEYPRTYRSAHFLGRGHTGIAGASGEDAIFYNPAGIAEGKGIFKEVVFASPMIESSSSTRDVAREIGLQQGNPIDTLLKQQGIPQHAGANVFSGLILRRLAIGAFASSSTTLLLSKDPKNGGMQRVSGESLTNGGIVFSLAQDFWKNHAVGITTKYVNRTQASVAVNAVDANKVNEMDSDSLSMSGTGTGVDFGYTYRTYSKWSDFAFGLTVEDVGNTTYIPDEPTDLTAEQRPLKDQKQTVNLGVEVAPGSKLSRFKLLFDARDILSNTDHSLFKRIHIGTELTVLGIVGATAGLNQGYPTGGLYADMRAVRIDVGGYAEEVGDRAGERADERYFLRVKVGF